jgi:hypothetical protein
MQLISQLSHMPYKSGNDLYFCTSDGLAEAGIPQAGVPERFRKDTKVSFQPWRLVRLRDGVVSNVELPLPIVSPRQVICNPVVEDDKLTFIYNTSLWETRLDDLNPVQLIPNVFTGFKVGSKLVYASGKNGYFHVENGSVGVQLLTPFNFILRIIPNGDNYIITGKTGDRFHSILFIPDVGTSDILVNGQDVYKCCVDGDKLIHAVRVNDFEQRYLHIDDFELC